jgi:hypothetical protein
MSQPRITVIDHDKQAIGATFVADAILAADRAERPIDHDTRVLEFDQLAELKGALASIKRSRDAGRITKLPTLILVTSHQSDWLVSDIDDLLIPIYGYGRTRTIAIYA